VLVLHGLNLEIADAANRSGFNTRNQVALMDLIWAVRRIAFRHAVESPKIKRPPKHPVYPDRYRPGDPSDNTNKPRKRAREVERQHTGTGESHDPIDLDGDASGEGAAANSSAKRQKVAVGQIGRHKVELPDRSKHLNPVHPTKFPNSFANRQDRRFGATAATTNFSAFSRIIDLPTPLPVSTMPVFHPPRSLIQTPAEKTASDLRKVKNTLSDNVDAVLECARVMREMYNRDDRLANDAIYEDLKHLRERFDGCRKEAEEGIGHVQKILGWLVDSKEGIV
jgi:hypothetical protein